MTQKANQNQPAGAERRYLQATDLRVEVETREGGAAVRKLTGHAAVVNQLSEDLYGFREKIAPGAFKRAIEADDVRALWNHNSDIVLGRNRSGTLTLEEDEIGLRIEVTPPDTQYHRDLLESVNRGDVSQMSFGFRTKSDSWETVDGVQIRTLLDVELFDISPVTYPAYPQTDVALRSLEAWRGTQPEPKPAAPPRRVSDLTFG